jgi:TfoX/Sxy family transcriptional regulator of competence genes
MMDQTFNERILDQLAPLGKVISRPMFGGWGIYWHETIFAIHYRDRLYFKVDEESKGEYLAKGMGPFRPNERQTLKCKRSPEPVLPRRLSCWVGTLSPTQEPAHGTPQRPPPRTRLATTPPATVHQWPVHLRLLRT